MIYFNVAEFECPCCHLVHMNHNFIMRLDDARGIAGVPFVVNSGYRYEKHNLEVGGSKTPSHLKGLAADFACDDSAVRFKMIDSLFKAGIKRLGIGSTFIHVDQDMNKTQKLIWTY